MDDITPNVAKRRSAVNQPVGCSTLLVNQPDCVRINQLIWYFKILFAVFNFFYSHIQEVIAHAEDALLEALNHYYIVSAHIIESTPQGKCQVYSDQYSLVAIELSMWIDLAWIVTRFLKNGSRRFAMQATYPDIARPIIIMDSYLPWIRSVQVHYTAEKHVNIFR